MNFPPISYEFFMYLGVILSAITIHEFSHAYFADIAGDLTPRSQGRLTLNPIAHFDPPGLTMIVISSLLGVGFGWGKPVQVNPAKMRNPRWDQFISVIAGPLSNILQATIYGLILRVWNPTTAEPLVQLLFIGLQVNLFLAVFNLIPLGPLDGHWIVGLLLPSKVRNDWYAFCRGPGSIILLGLVFFGREVLGEILGPPVRFLSHIILGYDFLG